MATVRDVVVRLRADTSGFNTSLIASQNHLLSLSSAAKIAGVAITGALAGGAAMAAKIGVGFLAMKEQAEIAFSSILGNAEAGQALISKLYDFAAKTPFEFKGITQSAQTLLAMGFSAKELLPTLKALGDATAALGAGPDVMARMAVNLGQMRAMAKISAVDMKQFAIIGINAWDVMAKQMGKSVHELQAQNEKGLLNTREAVDALIRGLETKFPDMMAKQSKTWNGLMSTMADQSRMAFGTIMEPMFNKAKKALDRFTTYTGTVDFTARMTLAGLVVERVGNIVVHWFSVQIPRAIHIANTAWATWGVIVTTAFSVVRTGAGTVVDVTRWLNEHRGVVAALVVTYAAFKAGTMVAGLVSVGRAAVAASGSVGFLNATLSTTAIGAMLIFVATMALLVQRLHDQGVEIDNARLKFGALAVGVAAAAVLMGGPLGFIVAAFALVMAALVIFQGEWDEVFFQLPDPVKQFVLAVVKLMDDLGTWLAGKLDAIVGKLNQFIEKVNKIPGVSIGKINADFEFSMGSTYRDLYGQVNGYLPNGEYGPVQNNPQNDRLLKEKYLPDGAYGPVAPKGASALMAGLPSLDDLIKKLKLDTEAANKAFDDYNNAMADGADAADSLAAATDGAAQAIQRSAHAADLAKAFIFGGPEMVAQVREFQNVSDELWPSVVAAAHAAGVEITDDDRQMWEDRLSNGQNYVDMLIALEEKLAAAAEKSRQETVYAFMVGGAEMVSKAQEVHKKLDAQWAEFVAAAKAANIEVKDSDREMWESRILNGQNAVDFLIAEEERLAQARQKAHDDAVAAVDQLGSLLETALQRQAEAERDSAMAVIEAQRTILDARKKSIDNAARAQRDALEASSRAQMDAFEASADAQLDSLKRTHDAAIRLIEEQSDAQVSAIQKQIDALDALDAADQRKGLQDALKIAYDPREQKRILDQLKQLDRQEERDRLRSKIDQIRDNADAQKQILDDLYDYQRDTLEKSLDAQKAALEAQLDAQRAALDAQTEAQQAALDAQFAALDAQAKAVDAKYAAQTDAFTIQSKVREMIMNGEVEKMSALLDQFVPEWRFAGLSYGQQLIDGFKTSGVEEYIAGVLAQIKDLQNQANSAASTIVGVTPGGTQATMSDKIKDQESIKAMVAGGAPQAAIDAQRSYYQQTYGEPSPFARGGVFTRPTLGLVGEYANAATNPEVLAPENTIRTLFRDELRQHGGSGGGQPSHVEVRVFVGEREITDIVRTEVVTEFGNQRRGAKLHGVRGVR